MMRGRGREEGFGFQEEALESRVELANEEMFRSQLSKNTFLGRDLALLVEI